MAAAPGLGLIQEVVVDSHFAQRGRLGRLMAAVAQNPANRISYHRASRRGEKMETNV